VQEIYSFHTIYQPKSTQFTINFLSEEATVWGEIWKEILRESWHIKCLKEWYPGKLSPVIIQDSSLRISLGNSQKTLGNEENWFLLENSKAINCLFSKEMFKKYVELFWSTRQKQLIPQCQQGSNFIHRCLNFEPYRYCGMPCTPVLQCIGK
jgi:hypothetical protein